MKSNIDKIERCIKWNDTDYVESENVFEIDPIGEGNLGIGKNDSYILTIGD